MLRERCSRLAYFSLHRLIGSRLPEHYQEFRALETKSPQSMQDLQAERLTKLLAHASAHVPFYRQRIQPRAGLSLRDFPVLTKNDIRRNFEDLMSPQIRDEHLAGKQRMAYSWLP